MNRYILSFFLTIIVYGSLFGIVVLYNHDNQKVKQKSRYSTQRVSFTMVAQKKTQQKVIKKEKKVHKPKPKPKKIIKKKHLKKKVIKKKKLINPKPKRIIKKRAIKKKVVKKQKQPKPQKTQKKEKEKNKINNKKQIEKKFIPKPQIKQNILKSDSILDEKKGKLEQKQKEQYFNKIKKLINNNKIYPKSAIRRGVQGSVEVEFTVSKYGELIDIKIKQGKRIFVKSVKNAIKNSFPIAPPKDLFTQQFSLTVTLVYRLR